jgi:pimeloyl-ACP methyl ester carboxylesterase
MEEVMLEKVTSSDGTRIAYYRSGDGPPLVLVTGTGAANPRAWPAFPLLEEHFTVYSVDRRGRGESGDAESYAIEREYEDIAVVVDSIGEPANLLGFSFGGLIALEAARLTRNLHKLVLYEPAIPFPGVEFDTEESIERFETLIEKGDLEEVLNFHFNEIGMSADEIDQMKSTPAWHERLAIVPTYPREMRATERYEFDARRFNNLHVPILLLLGGDSLPNLKDATKAVHAAFPHSQIAVMPGQQHIAMYTAPQLFLDEIRKFIYA